MAQSTTIKNAKDMSISFNGTLRSLGLSFDAKHPNQQFLQ